MLLRHVPAQSARTFALTCGIRKRKRLGSLVSVTICKHPPVANADCRAAVCLAQRYARLCPPAESPAVDGAALGCHLPCVARLRRRLRTPLIEKLSDRKSTRLNSSHRCI